MRVAVLAAALLLLYVLPAHGQFFVRLGGDKDKKADSAVATDGGGTAVADASKTAAKTPAQVEQDWQVFVKWFRQNGGILSSKLTAKLRNNRQGIYFKERMRRGETIVSFPRTLRMDEKSALKSKIGPTLLACKEKGLFPDNLVIIHGVWERFHNPDSFWKSYLALQPNKLDNIMYLTDAEMRALLRRPGCENTHNLGVAMRRTFERFWRQYKSLVMPDYQDEVGITRDELLWGFNFLVSSGWGSAPDGTGDKMLVPFSDFPNHRRESAQKASNRGFISAAKEYQAGEELTFDYGLLNDAVLAYFGIPTPDCRGLRR